MVLIRTKGESGHGGETGRRKGTFLFRYVRGSEKRRNGKDGEPSEPLSKRGGKGKEIKNGRGNAHTEEEGSRQCEVKKGGIKNVGIITPRRTKRRAGHTPVAQHETSLKAGSAIKAVM